MVVVENKIEENVGHGISILDGQVTRNGEQETVKGVHLELKGNTFNDNVLQVDNE